MNRTLLRARCVVDGDQWDAQEVASRLGRDSRVVFGEVECLEVPKDAMELAVRAKEVVADIADRLSTLKSEDEASALLDELQSTIEILRESFGGPVSIAPDPLKVTFGDRDNAMVKDLGKVGFALEIDHTPIKDAIKEAALNLVVDVVSDVVDDNEHCGDPDCDAHSDNNALRDALDDIKNRRRPQARAPRPDEPKSETDLTADGASLLRGIEEFLKNAPTVASTDGFSTEPDVPSKGTGPTGLMDDDFQPVGPDEPTGPLPFDPADDYPEADEVIDVTDPFADAEAALERDEAAEPEDDA